jgi:hypothetical protein
MFVLEIVGRVCGEARNLPLNVIEPHFREWQLSRICQPYCTRLKTAIEMKSEVKRVARSNHAQTFTPSVVRDTNDSPLPVLVFNDGICRKEPLHIFDTELFD